MDRPGINSMTPSPIYPDTSTPTDFLAQFASSLAVGPEEALGMLGDRLLSYEPLAPRPRRASATVRELDPAERA